MNAPGFAIRPQFLSIVAAAALLLPTSADAAGFSSGPLPPLHFSNVLPMPKMNSGAIAFDRGGAMNPASSNTAYFPIPAPFNPNAAFSPLNNFTPPLLNPALNQQMAVQQLMINQARNPLNMFNPGLNPFLQNPALRPQVAPVNQFVNPMLALPMQFNNPQAMFMMNPMVSPFTLMNPYATFVNPFTNPWNQVTLRQDGIYYPVAGTTKHDRFGNPIPGTSVYINPISGNSFQNQPYIPPTTPPVGRAMIISGPPHHHKKK